MIFEDLKVVDLFDEIEKRIRRIIREEITNVLLEGKSNVDEQDEGFSFNRKSSTLLTSKDVAKILGVNVQRVWELVRMRETNGFPVIILGERQYRFSKEEIFKWMNRKNQ
ncbi:MAG: helix-turn-helix domain-containing protein [Pyrinomonadaceae bacterium]|nr:helix-turn-helix domain-containing protein [Pyrinomonadaceae bacterium]